MRHSLKTLENRLRNNYNPGLARPATDDVATLSGLRSPCLLCHRVGVCQEDCERGHRRSEWQRRM